MPFKAGARAGLVAPDEKTYAYLKGRRLCPKGAEWDKAVAYWKTLPSDPGAKYDTEVTLDVSEIVPQVTWGTSPQDEVPITGSVPNPADQPDPATVTKLLATLAAEGVIVERATAPFTAAGKRYAAGTYVIRLAQVFGRYAKDMLEPQVYPEVSPAPGVPAPDTTSTLTAPPRPRPWRRGRPSSATGQPGTTTSISRTLGGRAATSRLPTA